MHMYIVATACPPDWFYYYNNCYYPSDEKVTYTAARNACLAMGADLVSISDQQEMNFVLSISY